MQEIRSLLHAESDVSDEDEAPGRSPTPSFGDYGRAAFTPPPLYAAQCARPSAAAGLYNPPGLDLSRVALSVLVGAMAVACLFVVRMQLQADMAGAWGAGAPGHKCDLSPFLVSQGARVVADCSAAGGGGTTTTLMQVGGTVQDFLSLTHGATMASGGLGLRSALITEALTPQECQRWLAPGPGGIHRLQAFCDAAWSGLRAMQDAVGTSGLVVDPMVAVHICGVEDNRGLLETAADLDFRLRGLQDYVLAGSLREEEAHAGGALRALVHSAVKANIFGGPADAVVCVQRASGTSMHAPALLGLRMLARTRLVMFGAAGSRGLQEVLGAACDNLLQLTGAVQLPESAHCGPDPFHMLSYRVHRVDGPAGPQVCFMPP